MSGCSIRAIWILTLQDSVAFSRRFPVVEKKWRVACERDAEFAASPPTLPTDFELAAAFSDRKRREGSANGYGIRTASSIPGSDSWLDDPITRYIITLHITREEESKEFIIWPMILHTRGNFHILILPLVEPKHIRAFEKLYRRNNCGGENEDLSSLLLELPCITGAFMVAHTIGDILTGETQEPEVTSAAASASSAVSGLLDTLTGSIGMAVAPRPKPVSEVTSAATSAGGLAVDKDLLRAFINSSMPYGTPLDLNQSNISLIRNTGFGSTESPPPAIRQPAWKPFLYKGKQRILFLTHETLNASLYDREEIPDYFSISGQVNCRAELEGLPDIQLPLTGFKPAKAEIVSYHHCAQYLDQVLVFQPPLGSFLLVRYRVEEFSSLVPVKGFYQLSMVSENEGAFLFRLKIMEGYNKGPYFMDFCTVLMPFGTRRVVSYDGTPSVGTVVMSEKSIEWKIVASGRGICGKIIDATFSGTVRFHPINLGQRVGPVSLSRIGRDEEDSDEEREFGNNGSVNLEDALMQKINKGLEPIDLGEPLCWQAYNYAKVSFKITGGTISGMTIDPKSVSIYPAVKAPVEYSMQVTAGDYILWNTLGRCPSAAVPKH
ncbi:hypothetical protein LUZ60_015559 [Juncus effusus]|nr:hypothetical protein LUZ60_015559 [Juncus effusus]